MRIAVIAAVLAAVLAGPAQAKTTAAEAKPSLLTQAQGGDADAQFQLGMAYLRGKGMKRNPSEGVSWLALAAANGSSEAAVQLAKLYESGGRGIRKGEEDAARWRFRAAKMGDEASRDRFVDLFLDGRTPDDLGGDEVAGWLEERAKDGNTAAILGLGDMYEHGRGVAEDTAKAADWYLKAALGGNAEARFRLGRVLLKRPAMWRIPEAEFRDGKWTGAVYYTVKPKDDDRAQLMRPGMIEAEHWLRAAAEQGHVQAQYALGMARLKGFDLPFDMSEAMRWLQAAATQNHPQALMMLADLAAKGYGFREKDPVWAWVCYDMAAQLGQKDAYRQRDMLAATMSGRQVARARQMAQEMRLLRGL